MLTKEFVEGIRYRQLPRPLVVDIKMLQGIVALLCSLQLAMPANAACKIAQIAELHVRLAANTPIMDGEINGQSVQVELNTGGYRTFIGGETARRLHLPLRQYTDERAYGVGGPVPILTAVVNELKLGQFTAHDVRLAVLDTVHNDPYEGTELALGADFFAKFTTEFDLTHGVVRLLLPDGCQSGQLVYWDKAYSMTDIEAPGVNDPRFHTNVSINGKRLRALLDTGASVSHISLQAAESVGVTPGGNGTTPATAITGIAGKPIESWIGQFDTFAIGNEMIRNAKLRISNMYANNRIEITGSHIPVQISGADMIIGADFLMAHRVLISPQTRKMVFTYTGGPVFQLLRADEQPEAAQGGERGSPPAEPPASSP